MVWAAQNHDVHGADATTRQQAIIREVRRDLWSLYDTLAQMEASAQPGAII